MTAGVPIGKAAAFLGITVKTIRHYHRLGLVAEPGRDTSGYRRYRSADLTQLLRVRTLAAAGVPLADVRSLLEAGPDAVEQALVGIERNLDARIAHLQEQKEALRHLAFGDRALLPDRANALLDGLTGIGFPPHEVTAAREAFVLARTLVPDRFEDYLSDIELAVADPGFVDLIARTAQLDSWPADDPRVDQLAEELAAHYLTHPGHLQIVTRLQASSDAAERYEMIAHHGERPASAGARLALLVERRLRDAGIRLPR